MKLNLSIKPIVFMESRPAFYSSNIKEEDVPMSNIDLKFDGMDLQFEGTAEEVLQIIAAEKELVMELIKVNFGQGCACPGGDNGGK